MPKVLVVDDESLIAESIVHTLRFEHYDTAIAEDGETALEMLLNNSFDLAILDWNLPKMSGAEVCSRYNASSGQTLILMLTAHTTVDDRIAGLDAGADDYLTKPFDPKELQARVKALLRRSGPRKNADKLQVGAIFMEPANFYVSKNGEDVKLMRKEFAILELLMRHQGRVFSTEEIINRVWAADDVPTSDVIRSHVRNIRKKLGEDDIIRTVHGVGYKVEGA